jgi:hypothetical protein
MSIDLEFAIKKDIRNNPVVREVDAQQKREFRQTVTIVALVVAMLLFWAWPQLEVMRSGYQNEQLRLGLDEAQARNRHLRLELETVTAPQVVDERARRTLHLIAPTEQDTIIVERVQPGRPNNTVVADARRGGGR